MVKGDTMQSHRMNEIRKSIQLSRRQVLRGIGVSMALPWLESLNVYGDEQVASQAPVRTVVMFSGNGFHSKEWWAKREGMRWSSEASSNR